MLSRPSGLSTDDSNDDTQDFEQKEMQNFGLAGTKMTIGPEHIQCSIPGGVAVGRLFR